MKIEVMNWFLGLTMGAIVLVFISSAVYARIKRKRPERLPASLPLSLGFAVCAVAIMNLRDSHQGLAVALTVVEFIIVIINGRITWRRFVKHLRNEGLIANKRGEQPGS